MCTYIFKYKSTNNELKKILNYTVINVSIRITSIRTILNHRDISRVLRIFLYCFFYKNVHARTSKQYEKPFATFLLCSHEFHLTFDIHHSRRLLVVSRGCRRFVSVCESPPFVPMVKLGSAKLLLFPCDSCPDAARDVNFVE